MDDTYFITNTDEVENNYDTGEEEFSLKPGETKWGLSFCEMYNAMSGKGLYDNATEFSDLATEAKNQNCIGTGVVPGGGNTIPASEQQPPEDEGDSGDLQGAPNVKPDVSVGKDFAIEGQDGTSFPGEEPQKPPSGEPQPNHGGEVAQDQTGGGDPVHLFRGTFYLEETDFDLNTSVLPLVFMRRYQSGFSYFGPFGWNWDHNHNIYLRELHTGAIARWNGRLHEDIFQPTGAGFEPPRGVFETLEPKPGIAQAYVIRGPEGLEWHFEHPAGWTDAEKIPLVLVRDRHGNTLEYSYNTDNKVEKVRDDDDRFLLFEYGNCGLLEAVYDHSGRQIQYHHAMDIEHLSCVRFPATTDYPEGTQKVYHYEQPHLSLELRHNIVRIEDGEGLTYLENSYEQDPSAWHYTRVIEQQYGDYIYQFRYTQLQYVPAAEEFVNIPALRVEVMNPDYGVNTHTFNYRGDLLDYRYRLSKDKSYRVVAYQFEYDGQGNRSKIVLPDGGEELQTFAFDHPDPRMRGRLLKRELRARTGFPAPSRIVFQAEYEPTFQLVKKIVDESLQETDYVYDFDEVPDPTNTGKLRKIVLPDATLADGATQTAELNIEMDDRGQVSAVISPAGIRREISFGAAGNARGLATQSIDDATGLAIIKELDYDSRGNVQQIIDGEGALSTLVYNALDQLETFTTPEINGNTVAIRSHYNTDGYLVRFERPRGNYSDAVIADSHIIDTLERNVLGHVERLEYGVNTDASRVITQCVDYRGLAILVIDPAGTETHQIFDERGYLIRRMLKGPDETEKNWKWVYDRAGRLVQQITGQDNLQTTKYKYDAFGRLSKVILPNGSEQTYTYAPNDVLLEEKLSGDPGDGATRLLSQTNYEYDERQRMIREKQQSFVDDPVTAVALVESYFYDKDDRLVRAKDHRGGITQLQYDGLNRLVELTDPEGNIIRYQYDRENRKVREEHLEAEAGAIVSRVWQWEYDARGRVVGNIQPDGASTLYQYDDRDLAILQTEPLGVVKKSSYGQVGELLQTTLDPTGLNITHTWVYDRKSRPITFTDPTGQVTTYQYDGLGRSIGVQQPNGFTSTRIFDTDGRLAKEVLASGVEISFAYDFVGRLNKIISAGAAGVASIPDHTFTYDGRNQLITAQSGSIKIRRTFDSLGRLISEEQNGTIQQIAYDDLNGTIDRLWPDGRREQIVTDLNGQARELNRLATGTVAGDTPQLGLFNLTGPSALESATLLDNIAVNYRYDIRKRPISVDYQAGANVIEQIRYRYDSRNRTRFYTSLLNQLNRHQGFDLRDRLTETDEGFAPPPLSDGFSQIDQDSDISAVEAALAGAFDSHEFTYNAADDRLMHKHTGDPDIPYTYAAGHKVLKAGNESFTHHSDGIRASDARNQYEIDALGRIISIKDAGGANVLYRFQYDAFGRLVGLEETGAFTKQLYYFNTFAKN